MVGCPIHECSETLRPRERLFDYGVLSLSPEELLALIIGSGRIGEDVVSLSRRVLAEMGGLGGLKNRTPEELCRISGIGPAKAAAILAALGLADRVVAESRGHRPLVRGAGDLRESLLSRIGSASREIFVAAWLDGAHRLIGIEELFQGGINYASISSRVVVERALARGAAAVIVAHNHPSGVLEPSVEDKKITDLLRKALQLVEIRLLDHLLVVSDDVVSVGG